MAGNGDDAGVLGGSWGLMTAKYRCSVGVQCVVQVEKQTHRRCRSEKSRPGSHFSNLFVRRLGYIYLIAISV